jgi:hypothetical protein
MVGPVFSRLIGWPGRIDIAALGPDSLRHSVESIPREVLA